MIDIEEMIRNAKARLEGARSAFVLANKTLRRAVLADVLCQDDNVRLRDVLGRTRLEDEPFNPWFARDYYKTLATLVAKTNFDLAEAACTALTALEDAEDLYFKLLGLKTLADKLEASAPQTD